MLGQQLERNTGRRLGVGDVGIGDMIMFADSTPINLGCSEIDYGISAD